MTLARWWWRRHQARRDALQAANLYRRRPTPLNDERYRRACQHLRRIEASRP